jgi:hypothetical protein
MSDSPPPEIPESFIEQVKEALENLYDFPALQHCALGLRSTRPSQTPRTVCGES